MTERLTDNWTSVASQGEGDEAKRRRVVLRRRNVKTNVTTGEREEEREGEREAAVLFYVAADATPTPACLQL